MPPRRPPQRSGPSHPQPTPPSPASIPDASPHNNPSNQASSPSHPSPSFVSTEDDNYLTPFLNTTFSTHRLSPLNVGSQPLSQDRLQVLTQRLRDCLVGDIVRGIEVGLDCRADDGAMRRAGVLESVGIAWVTLESLLGACPGQQEERGGLSGPGRNELGSVEARDLSASTMSTGYRASPTKRKALQISLQYERAECAALLLPSTKGIAAWEGTTAATGQTASAAVPAFNFGESRPNQSDLKFLHLPLLLMRMPTPLKDVVIDFLSRTFDCRISALSLGSRSLVQALEKWTGKSAESAKGQLARDVVLTLGFYGPEVMRCQRRQQKGVAPDKKADGDEDALQKPESAMGIKSADIIVPSADVWRFVIAGKADHLDKYEQQHQPWHKCNERGVQDCVPYDDVMRRKLGGDNDEEGWTWRQWPAAAKHSRNAFDAGRPQPFIEALSQYLQQHLALDIFHPAVRVSKVACGGFVLSEGRVKIFGVRPFVEGEHGGLDTEQRALWRFMDGLLETACVEPLDQRLRG